MKIEMGQVWLAKPNRSVDDLFYFEIVGKVHLPSGPHWLGLKQISEDELRRAPLDTQLFVFYEDGKSMAAHGGFGPLVWQLVRRTKAKTFYQAP